VPAFANRPASILHADGQLITDGQTPPFEAASLCLQHSPGTFDWSAQAVAGHAGRSDDPQVRVEVGYIDSEPHADGVDRSSMPDQQSPVAGRTAAQRPYATGRRVSHHEAG